MNKPAWRVTVATDNGKILELQIDPQLGQLYIGASESRRPPEHVATFSSKTQSLGNLIDALIEARDHLDGAQPAGDMAVIDRLRHGAAV